MSASGFASIWLPEQQEHGTGRKAHFDILRGDLHRGPMWTEHDEEAGDLVRSPWQVLPAGDYIAVQQLWHRGDNGRPAGSLIAESEDGRILAERHVVTADHDFGDWQRELISFRLDAPAKVRIRLKFIGGISLWTGSLHLGPAAPRPIHIIGHNRNTPEAIDLSLKRGANSIEGDFSYRHGKLLVAETPPYPGWMHTSEPAEWLAYLQSRRQEWEFIYFDCKLAGVPDNNFYKFGQELCTLVRAAGIAPSACLFGIGDATGLELFRALRDSGFAEAATAMDGFNDSNPEHGAPESWPAAAMQYHLPCIGMGRASIELTKPLAHWLPALAAAATARDSGQEWPCQVMFWTLGEKAGMRKVLDLGIDAIIAEREDHLVEVLAEEPYRSFCRRAGPADWKPFQVHGRLEHKSAAG